MSAHTVNRQTIQVPTAADTAGDERLVDTAGAGSCYFQVKGSFTAQYTLQGSIDGGATWWDCTFLLVSCETGLFLDSPISAEGLFIFWFSRPPPMVRLYCQSYTSGAPTGAISYRSPS